MSVATESNGKVRLTGIRYINSPTAFEAEKVCEHRTLCDEKVAILADWGVKSRFSVVMSMSEATAPGL